MEHLTMPLLVANIGLLAWNLRETYSIRIMLENFRVRLSAVEERVNQRKKRT